MTGKPKAERKARTMNPDVAAIREYMKAKAEVRILTDLFKALGKLAQEVKAKLDEAMKRKAAAYEGICKEA